MRPFLLAPALVVLLAAPALFADSNTCDTNNPPVPRDFSRQPSDVLQPRHLELVRPFTGTGKLEFNVCAAELHVRSRPNLDHLRLVVDLGDQPGGRPLEDYLQRIHVEPSSSTFDLKLPPGAHATVTLELPMSANSDTEINLGRGDLDFNAVDTAGNREINLGAGRLDLTAGGDRFYSSLAMNIGMGTLHDHRPGGHNAHFIISQNEAGSGQGPLSINIGAGTLNIRE